MIIGVWGVPAVLAGLFSLLWLASWLEGLIAAPHPIGPANRRVVDPIVSRPTVSPRAARPAPGWRAHQPNLEQEGASYVHRSRNGHLDPGHHHHRADDAWSEGLVSVRRIGQGVGTAYDTGAHRDEGEHRSMAKQAR